ncbi:MAG: thiamine-phosphate pyrophosphorylase [Candidatus Omnitrophota bacterium]|nr:thiamine-phosphate pyrophosphorylase [Candidatus Omnitrophota bacterium]
MRKTESDNRILRVIDANANRLTEGLRVCEDTARFILNDKKATQSFKSLRHRTFAAIKKLGADKKLLTAFRDSARDVGKSSIKPEARRNTVSDIFRANVKRSEEAMRVLEEFSKLRNTILADSFKEMRFELYSLEKRIIEKL